MLPCPLPCFRPSELRGVEVNPTSLMLALDTLTLGELIGALRCTADPEAAFHECMLPDRFDLIVASGSASGRPYSKASSATGAGEAERTGVLDVEGREDVAGLEVEFEEGKWAGRSSVAIVLLRNWCFVMCEESSAMCKSVLSRRRE